MHSVANLASLQTPLATFFLQNSVQTLFSFWESPVLRHEREVLLSQRARGNHFEGERESAKRRASPKRPLYPRLQSQAKSYSPLDTRKLKYTPLPLLIPLLPPSPSHFSLLSLSLSSLLSLSLVSSVQRFLFKSALQPAEKSSALFS